MPVASAAARNTKEMAGQCPRRSGRAIANGDSPPATSTARQHAPGPLSPRPHVTAPRRPATHTMYAWLPVQRRHDHPDVRLRVRGVTAFPVRCEDYGLSSHVNVQFRALLLWRWPGLTLAVTVRANNKCVPDQRERERERERAACA
jgi:hypothetical protein